MSYTITMGPFIIDIMNINKIKYFTNMQILSVKEYKNTPQKLDFKSNF